MDKKGNLKRNLIVISVMFAVMLGGIAIGLAVDSNNQATNPQFYNVTLANGSALAAYTMTNWNNSHSGGGACTIWGTGNTLVASPRHTIGGTVTFYVNISGSPNVANGYGNVTNYTSVEMFYMRSAHTNATYGYLNDSWQSMGGTVNDSNMTLYDPNGNQAAGNKDVDSGKSCGNSPETGGGHTCANVSSSHWTNGLKNGNYTRLFWKTWNTDMIDGEAVGLLSNNSAKCVWIGIVVKNGTTITNPGVAQWNGTDVDNQGIWVNIDNRAPEVQFNETGGGCGGTTVSSHKCNKSNENEAAGPVGTLQGNFTIVFNQTSINDSMFGPGNVNTVWVKIQSVGSTKLGTNDNLSIYSSGAEGNHVRNGSSASGSQIEWQTSKLMQVNNSYLAPGKHWVWWCANDTVNNVNCSTGITPIYFDVVNATQLEEAFCVHSDWVLDIDNINGSSIGDDYATMKTSNCHYESIQQKAGQDANETMNITYNIGNSNGAFGKQGRQDFGFKYQAYNFTFYAPDYSNESVAILGAKFNSSLIPTLQNINTTNITEGLSYMEAATVTNSSDMEEIASYWVDIGMVPDKSYYPLAMVKLNATYDADFYCTGTAAAPTCEEIYVCNSTPTVFPNDTVYTSYLNATGSGVEGTTADGTLMAANGACFVESGGLTYIYARHLSGVTAGNDGIGPTVQIAVDDTSIEPTGKAAITCTADDYYAVQRIVIEVGGDSLVCNGTEISSCGPYTYYPKSTGVKAVTCNAYDEHTNRQEATTTITVANAGGGGSSGGGVGGSSTTTSTDIKGGEPTIIPVGAETGIESIDLTLTTTTKGVSITTTAMDAKPATVEAISAKIYSYVNFATQNLAESNIQKAEVEFKVPSNWLLTQSIDAENIVMYRYANNDWVELPTTMSKENTNFAYYTTTTPGFSTFAIGEKGGKLVPGTIEEQLGTGSAGVDAWVWYVLGGLVILLGIVGVVYYYLGKKKA